MRITQRLKLAALIILMQWSLLCVVSLAQDRSSDMMDIEQISQRLKNHLTELTVAIGERSVQSMPRERRAFHARGVIAHAVEGGELVQVLREIRKAARQSLGHRRETSLRRFDRQALDDIGHQRGGRHRDRAARALETGRYDVAVANL